MIEGKKSRARGQRRAPAGRFLIYFNGAISRGGVGGVGVGVGRWELACVFLVHWCSSEIVFIFASILHVWLGVFGLVSFPFFSLVLSPSILFFLILSLPFSPPPPSLLSRVSSSLIDLNTYLHSPRTTLHHSHPHYPLHLTR